MRSSCLLATALACAVAAPAQRADPPNIVVVMLDDMGFSDIGCYGSEIETPNIDSLAAGGVRFTQFYNTARCCPTRASLLTGVYPHQAGVGWMMADNGHDGYRGELSRATPTIAEVLRKAGYGTYMSGKWHVTKHTSPDGPKDNWPRARGFDRFFGTIHGAGSFYDPNSLTLDDTFLVPGEGFYYTDAISEWGVRFILEHDEKRPGDPLFLYLAYTAPHWPLHALPEDIAKYRGRYDSGWDALRTERRERMVGMGLVDAAWGLTARDTGVTAWEETEDREWHALRMEVYAAMIDRVDQQFGRVLDSLRKTKRLDDTLILFLADNGGCAEEYGSRGAIKPDPSEPFERKPMGDDELQHRMQPRLTRDGRPVRTGRGVVPGPADTYIAYGKGWANASNTPFRRYKHWVHEGGISSPLIAHWPNGIKRRGVLETQPGHVIDVIATCVAVSGAEPPALLEGRSLLPAFAGEPVAREALFWEHEGNRAVRVGDLKLTAAGRNGAWELYDLASDRTERSDLAAQRPAQVAALARRWNAWAERAHVLPLTPYWQSANEKFSAERRFVLTGGADLDRGSAPDVGKRGFVVEAVVETKERDGVIVAQGGGSHGWALFLRAGVPHLAFRRSGRLTVLRTEKVTSDRFELHAEIGQGGALLLRSGEDEARGKARGLLTQMPVDGLQIGRDDKGAVADYETPFALAGDLRVVIELREL